MILAEPSFITIGGVFPPPSGLDIHMMPFLVGHSFKASQLPEYVRPYWSMLKTCMRPDLEISQKMPCQLGRVWYLTVKEGWVDGGTPQRKAGLHVDSLSSVHIANREEEETGREGRGVSKLLPIGDKGGHFILGKGWVEDRRCYTYALQGGIYMATSMPNSKAWNCRVDRQAVGR